MIHVLLLLHHLHNFSHQTQLGKHCLLSMAISPLNTEEEVTTNCFAKLNHYSVRVMTAIAATIMFFSFK